jgi:hypothetical protein
MKLNSSRLEKALLLANKFIEHPDEDKNERAERLAFYQRLKHEEFSELLFSEFIKKLWGMRIWGNKDYVVGKMIESNGFEKIKNIFKYFINDDFNIKEGYEKLNSIKYMGPSMATELLCYFSPTRAGIWNSRARVALKWLEVEGFIDAYKLTGDEYEIFNSLLIELAQIFGEGLGHSIDLLELDYFIWEIANKFENEVKEEKDIKRFEEIKTISTRSRHDELRDKVAKIGSGLGFEVDIELMIAVGAKIDVIWKSRIANLGVISYVFEVQDRGSIDSLIVNLQKAQANSAVQKLIIVSDAEQILKIKQEIESMPEVFKKDLAFWDSAVVDKTYLNLEQVTNAIAELNLVNEDF